MLGLTELRKLSDEKLQKYFERHAVYMNRPRGDEFAYSIRAGMKALFADDTHTLREKFFAAVQTDVWPEPRTP